MNILIAVERKNLLSALKLLLETEINEIGHIEEVFNRRDLSGAIETVKPDILLMDGDFINVDTKDEVVSFKKDFPGMSLVIMDFDNEKKRMYQEMNIDLFITKGSSSYKVLNSLIDFVKRKMKQLKILQRV
jgi:DNA-binding NarL/FixJ family response regulator